LGTAGYGEAVRTYTTPDASDGIVTDNVSPGAPVTGVNTSNETGAPKVVFSNDREAVYLADFTGDGLSDLVRIMNGDISYWPNIGYGRFGSKITMENSPWMDTLDAFTYSRLRLGDIDGSGCADLLYFPPSGGLKIWINEAGNSFPTIPYELSFPQIDSLSSLNVLDLFGSGTSSVVWSSSSPGLAEGMRLQYAEFNRGMKPHLLKTYKKGPVETRLEYTPSAQFYQDDKLRGAAWATKLPFPVQCLSSVETFDFISGNYNTSQYKYHQGFYDGIEREFRGFGFVASAEREYVLGTPSGDGFFTFPNGNESLKGVISTHPVLSKKWYYTGAFFEQENVRQAFGAEYYQNKTMGALGGPVSLRTPAVEGSMTPEESRQAWRTLKGSCLREEMYQTDGSSNEAIPFFINDNSYGVVILQPSSTRNPISRPGVFQIIRRESLSIQLERNAADLRVGHKMVLEIDNFGNETKSVSINYGRSKSEITTELSADDIIVQTTNIVLYTEQSFTNAIDTPDVHLVPQPAGTTNFQIHGVAPSNANDFFTPSDFGTKIALDNFKFRTLPLKDYADDTSTQGLRLLGGKQMRYRSDDLSQLLSFRKIESLAIPAQSYNLAITPDIFSSCYQSNKDSPLLQEATLLSQKGPGDGGYIDLNSDQSFWIPSGTKQFISIRSTSLTADVPTTTKIPTPAAELAAARLSFFTPVSFTDPFGKIQTVTYDNKFLFPITIVDAVGNTTTAKYDYSNMQLVLITDANGNQEAFDYDELGSCIYHASLGNPSIKTTGDTVDGANPFRSREEIQALLADPVSKAAEFLGKGTSCVFFDFPAQNPVNGSWSPAFQISIQRDTHISDLNPGQESNMQLQITYLDGRGRIIQRKQYCDDDADENEWITNASTLNRNGDALITFLPAYENSHAFSIPAETSPATRNFYDALKRVVATLNPDLTWTKTIYGSWNRVIWDGGDTIELDPLTDTDVGLYFTLLSKKVPLAPSWLLKMNSLKDSFDQAAATQSLVYSKTPTEVWLDASGNDYCTIIKNGNNEKYFTRRFLDAQKHLRKVVDSKDRIVSIFSYDMTGIVAHSSSMESGQKWSLNDVTGHKIFAWDSRTTRNRYSYDDLRRLNKLFIKSGTDNEYLSQYNVYGETQTEPEKNNLRGKIYQAFDQASKVTTLQYDYAGKSLHVQKQLVQEYKTSVSWQSEVPVEMEQQVFESTATYDALHRCVSETRCDGSVVANLFNRQGLLKTVRGALASAFPVALIDDVQYNASSQQISAVYGNGSTSQTAYDPLTLKMTSKNTTRKDHSVVQSLKFTRDCVGNITHIDDTSQQNLFFRGAIIKPTQYFTYDATSRLSSATGREHLGQIGQNQFSTPSSALSGRDHTASPADSNSVSSYTEKYAYDSENNILSIVHSLVDTSIPGWTRVFNYNEPSSLEPTKSSNRLTSTVVGNETSSYSYSGTPGLNGLMSHMTGFPILQWDVDNRLAASSTQNLAPGSSQTPEMTYYRYDNSGRRVRKVTERFADVGTTPTKMKDHVYIDSSSEIFTKYAGDGTTTKKKIQTSHFSSGKNRIVSLELDSTTSNDLPSEPLTRYALTDQTSSITVELDDQGQIISQEEYSPYGSSTFSASPQSLKIPKRYRFSGKELDVETGLYYFEQRYLVPWLGRWLSPDPIGIADGNNVWAYCGGNPVSRSDMNGCMQRGEGGMTPAASHESAASSSSSPRLISPATIANSQVARAISLAPSTMSLATARGLLPAASSSSAVASSSSSSSRPPTAAENSLRPASYSSMLGGISLESPGGLRSSSSPGKVWTSYATSAVDIASSAVDIASSSAADESRSRTSAVDIASSAVDIASSSAADESRSRTSSVISVESSILSLSSERDSDSEGEHSRNPSPLIIQDEDENSDSFGEDEDWALGLRASNLRGDIDFSGWESDEAWQ
jgi:RHS repeat-associated protein